MIYITFTNPKTKEKLTTQIVRSLVIGRGEDADMRIDGDSNVSRLHTLVVPRKDGRIEVRDLASASGTFVIQRGVKRRLTPTAGAGGYKNGRATLFDGESFFVGSHEINVHYKELPGEPTVDQSIFVEEDEDITSPGREI